MSSNKKVSSISAEEVKKALELSIASTDAANEARRQALFKLLATR